MKHRPPLELSIACLALALAWWPSSAAPRAAGLPAYSVGYEFSQRLSTVSQSQPLPVPDPNASQENPLIWRLEVFWAEVEKEKGIYDWSTLEALVDRFRAAGHEPVLCLWGGNPIYTEDILSPPTAQDEPYVQAWEAFTRAAARQFRGKVRFYEVWRNPNVPGLWPGTDAVRQYAFLLKRTATVLRAEGGRNVAVVTGGLFGADTKFLQELFDEGIGPYVDIVSVRPDPLKEVEPQVKAVVDLVASASPSAGVWAMGLTAPAGPADQVVGEICRRAIVAFGAGAKLVAFALPLGPAGFPERADALVRLHSILTPGLGLLPDTRARFEGAQGVALPAVRSWTFFDSEKGIAVVAYLVEGQQPAVDQATLLLDARRPGPPVLYDPVAGSQTQPQFEAVERGARGSVPLRSWPLFVLYREGAGKAVGEAVEKGPESVEVVARRGMTAEEVMTRHQEVATRQQALVKNYRAKGLVQFHFSLAGASQRVDVAMGGKFFYEPSVGPEWEFTDYWVNGNRSPWKKFPELPLVQPEKVVTLPLAISFDRSYAYDLTGEETVEGRDCWVLSFEPVDPEKSLYRGKVWIDKQTYNKVRTAVTQTRLDTPFISNEERDTYAPVTDDGELWLLKRIDGQQIYTTAGRNFIVLREVTFEDFAINASDFQQQRQAAYASEHQMLRDTEKGFRYLEKDTATGERKVKAGIDKSQVFGLAGAFYDNSRDYPLPLGGVNYFDYDFRGTGIQTNVFFAGALLVANATKPDIAGTGYDVGVDVFGVGVVATDQGFETGTEIATGGTKVVASGRELDAIDVSTRTERIAFNFGHAVGNFAKLRTSIGVARTAFGRTDETYRDDPKQLLPGEKASHFIVPADIWERSVELFGTYDRSGWSLNGSASLGSRSQWPFWGCPAGTVGGLPRTCGRTGTPQVPDWNPDSQDYLQYEVGGSKEWYLPFFQKIRGELDWFGGSDLDRFSRYQFSFFRGPRLHGFSGSGVRFDEGIVGRAIYSFNVANVVRFDATLDHARVKDKSSGLGTTAHTGLGVAGSFLGPWQTILQFDVGYALQSDVKAAKGDVEALLIVLKLF